MSNHETNRMQEVDQYMRLPYAIEVVRDECGGEPCFMASHPELPGCMAQGDTPAEAVNNLTEARRDYISALLSENIDVPTPEPIPDTWMQLQTVQVVRARRTHGTLSRRLSLSWTSLQPSS